MAAFNFAGDPINYVAPPVLSGVAIDLNVAVAVVTIVLGWSGFALTLGSNAAASE